MKTSRAITFVLAAFLAAVGLSGCGARDGAVQAPAGAKVGPPLTAAQAQAIQQQRQAGMQQRAQGQ